MNSALIYAVILVFVAITELYVAKQPKENKTYASIVVISLILFIIYQMVQTREGFHFEVTPWKTGCLGTQFPHESPASSPRCAKCCPHGYRGMNIGFEYASDKERLECGDRECSKLKNNPDDYYNLQDYNL